MWFKGRVFRLGACVRKPPFDPVRSHWLRGALANIFLVGYKASLFAAASFREHGAKMLSCIALLGFWVMFSSVVPPAILIGVRPLWRLGSPRLSLRLLLRLRLLSRFCSTGIG